MKTNITPFYFEGGLYFRVNDGTWLDRKGRDIGLRACRNTGNEYSDYHESTATSKFLDLLDAEFEKLQHSDGMNCLNFLKSPQG